MLEGVHLSAEPDTIAWRFGSKSTYSARSAYQLHFIGAMSTGYKKLIWKGWAPARCKFFIWTLMLDRVLTADKLLQRGWDNDYFCPLCRRNLETTSHLLAECPFSIEVWKRMSAYFKTKALSPQTGWARSLPSKSGIARWWACIQRKGGRASSRQLS
uniref:Uncharacterized protein n=1 Tax=Avena sativa TaxID=4498 RepID=A0ACD5UP66_AVESA